MPLRVGSVEDGGPAFGFAKTPPRAGLGLVGRADRVLLPVSGRCAGRSVGVPLVSEDWGGLASVDNLGDGDTLSLGACGLFVNAALTLLLLALPGVNPNPEVLVEGFALPGAFLAGERGRASGLLKLPSLVPGLLLLLFPRLNAEAGLDGGPIGDSGGAKNDDLLRSFGVIWS